MLAPDPARSGSVPDPQDVGSSRIRIWPNRLLCLTLPYLLKITYLLIIFVVFGNAYSWRPYPAISDLAGSRS